MVDDLLKKMSGKTFFLLHYALFSIGLVKISQFLAVITYRTFDFSTTINGVCEWMGEGSPEKLELLLQYIYCILAYLLYYLIGFLTIHFAQSDTIEKGLIHNTKTLFSYCLGAIALNTLFLFAQGKLLNVILLIIWFLTFFSISLLCIVSPHILQIIRQGIITSTAVVHKRPALLNSSYVLLISAIFIQFLLVFSPYIYKTMSITNDYLDIPEKTILSNYNVVDNTAFINAHEINGLIKYDPRTGQGETPPYLKENYIKLAHTPILDSFIKKRKKNRSPLYFYDNKTGILSVRGPMSVRDTIQLNHIYSNNPQSQKSINHLFISSNEPQNLHTHKKYTKDEIDFIKNNEHEMATQAQAGWFFFHHAWVFNPIHAIALGADPLHQPLIYGLGSALVMKKMMEYAGGINYQTYFKVLYAFYPLYFLIFLVTIFLVFKRMDFVCIAAALFSVCIFEITDEAIRLAPGFNPIRHFLDMPAFLMFYLYLKNSKPGYLCCSIVLSLFAVLWSKDFGICILLSISAAAMLQAMLVKRRPYLTLVPSFIACLLGLGLYLIPIGETSNSIYLLLGYATPKTPKIYMLISLLLISAVTTAYIHFIHLKKDPFFFLSLALFFYFQLGLVYFLWNPTPHHFFVAIIPFVFLLLTWAQMFDKRGSFFPYFFCTLSIFVFLYLPTLYYFYEGRKILRKEFSTHVIYPWTFKNATFKSTMDPELFDKSVQLISSYEKSPRVYLVSKYDSIMTGISDKYNALNTVNLALDLISKSDINRFFSLIKTNAPQYIFMDTDIARNFNGDIFEAHSGNYRPSKNRAAMLTNIHQLYDKLITLYTPGEQAGLLTVYKRKDAGTT